MQENILEELKELERTIQNAKEFIKENPNDDLVPSLTGFFYVLFYSSTLI